MKGKKLQNFPQNFPFKILNWKRNKGASEKLVHSISWLANLPCEGVEASEKPIPSAGVTQTGLWAKLPTARTLARDIGEKINRLSSSQTETKKETQPSFEKNHKQRAETVYELTSNGKKKTKVTETYSSHLTPKENRRSGAAKPENTCPINWTETCTARGLVQKGDTKGERAGFWKKILR